MERGAGKGRRGGCKASVAFQIRPAPAGTARSEQQRVTAAEGGREAAAATTAMAWMCFAPICDSSELPTHCQLSLTRVEALRGAGRLPRADEQVLQLSCCTRSCCRPRAAARCRRLVQGQAGVAAGSHQCHGGIGQAVLQGTREQAAGGRGNGIRGYQPTAASCMQAVAASVQDARAWRSSCSVNPRPQAHKPTGTTRNLCERASVAHLAQQVQCGLEGPSRHQQAGRCPGPPLCCRHMGCPSLHGSGALSVPASCRKGQEAAQFTQGEK